MIPHYTSKTIFAVSSGAAPEAFQGHLKMLAVAAAGFAVFAALRGWLFGVLNNRFVRNLRSRLFKVLMQEETAFHGEGRAAGGWAGGWCGWSGGWRLDGRGGWSVGWVGRSRDVAGKGSGLTEQSDYSTTRPRPPLAPQTSTSPASSPAGSPATATPSAAASRPTSTSRCATCCK
jgi:hypothetical protein